MEQGADFRKTVMEEYRQSVMPLLAFLPWLEQHSGRMTFTVYGDGGIKENSLSFPVYDSNLIRLVKAAEKTSLMDRNYRYVYSRNRIDSHEAERLMIQKATWRDWNNLKGILSRYVLGGRTKAALWSEAVKEDIFFLVLTQMKEIAAYLEGTM